MKNKIVSNFIYQLAYQLTLILLPIISIPIVSKSLGVEGIGTYNFITSVVSYFILISGLGLANYGIREIAVVKNDKKKLSEKFWTLELFNIIVASIVLIFYLLFIYILKLNVFFLISGISLIATLFDISWFYYGIEDFKQITTINIIVKILSFICIVLFIKQSDDLIIYFFIQCISILFSNISLWFYLRKKIHWVAPKFHKAMNHLKPALNYFVGKASITIYTTLNKTLLGLLASNVAVGLYTNSLQLTTIFITIIGTIDSVLLPHMTNLYSMNKEDEMLKLMENAINIQLFFSIPIMFGLILINTQFIPWFFGIEFNYLEYTVPVLSPLVIIIPLGTSIVRQYLIPLNHIKQFNISVGVAAIIGLIVNLLLIPFIGIWGAIIATLISELVVTGIRLVDLKKKTSFRFKRNDILVYFFSSIIMFFIVKIVTMNFEAKITTTFIQGGLGIIIYIGITSLLRKGPIIDYITQRRKNV
ncbi:polysaccharide biosynthesis C-terminal domain-containing protein [Vagococcus fluvialis]|uniref:oligosaccharide flippase family protein n=1 Tax=Vagococcus fluvialis TaxID=2738 RepID=UPI001A8D14E3|nr:polysaccharide biosynthesis C-terminal domain-containing protein [Vagococcus fluvialis]MBO0442881.1 polysaccharide biosynthesis C-terminal domain-containing protein [Vagococcus fluvialis]